MIRGRRSDRTEALLEVLSRLTARDGVVLELLLEHRLLTTPQLADLAFHGSVGVAKRRLGILTALGLVTRFRPPLMRGEGSLPFHYVLDNRGAVVVAARRDVDVDKLGYRRERNLALALSPRLAHIVGIHDVLAALVASARSRGGRLVAWKSERTWDTETWAEWVHPDACGRWSEAEVEGDFFLEYDRGTEAPSVLAEKLTGYAELAAHSRPEGLSVPPVLFWFADERREASAQRALAAAASRLGIAVATAAAPLGRPGEAVWVVLGAARERITLGELLARHGVASGLLRLAV